MKTFGLKSYEVSVTTSAAQIQGTNGQTAFVQNCIILAAPLNTASILVGGIDGQTFPLAAGASIDLGDLFIGSMRSEFDLGACWVKSASGTQTLHVLHNEEYTR
jgi:hypothetical protein